MSETVGLLGKGPFVFSGTPPILTGEIDLANDSAEKIKVRTIPVVDSADASVARYGLSEVHVGVRLQGHQQRRVPAHFRVDPCTPPGTYSAALAVGDDRRPVVAHVFEVRNVQVQPEIVQLVGAAGETLRQRVVVANRGNVTETLREVALVSLEEEDWIGRSLVQALRDTEATAGHQAYLDRVVLEIHAGLLSPTRVVVGAGVEALEPGQTAEVELEIRLPAEMVKGRSYFGSARFLGRDLSFEVECNGTAKSTQRSSR